MVSEDDWYDSSADDKLESAEESIRSMPLYDEDGVEIPDDELPWNNVPEEESPDASVDWMLDDSDEPEESNQSATTDNRSASAHCGKAFIARRADSRFCSAECRSKGRKRE